MIDAWQRAGDTMPSAGPFTLPQLAHLWGIDCDRPYRAMLLDFIEDQARRLAAARIPPATREGWTQHTANLRPRLLHSLGLPASLERSPLNARVVGTLEREGYRIEKVIFEPRPGFPVSAHLYLPSEVRLPVPAVLYAPGHWMWNSKLEPDIQIFCANLARRGCAALVYDPIGQGERVGDGLDHGHLEPLLVGLSQEGLMVWESIRAIDYLVSRPEVNNGRIGMTGHSGGGLNTFYTCAVDERIQVAVPVCFINTFFCMMAAERDRNWEDGMDLCNQVPGVMAYAEMSDICGLFAPRPLCVITAIHDWTFPLEGVREVFQPIKHIYSLLGSEGHVRLIEVDAQHSYNRTMREVAYGWLLHWLNGEGADSSIPELECELLPTPYPPASELRLPISEEYGQRASLCFADGRAPLLSPAITALATEMAQELRPTWSPPVDVDEWGSRRYDLLAQIPTILGRQPEAPLVWPDDAQAMRNRSFCRTLAHGLIGERIVFESEPGIDIPGMFLMPAEWERPVPIVLYIDEWGKQAGLANGIVEALLAEQVAILAIDVRGVGETAASDFEATTGALMTDRPLLGQRVWDVLSTVERLRRGSYVTGRVDTRRIGCIGRGAGGLIALYAAALDERLNATVLWQAPATYQALIVERPDFPPSAFLFDVLRHFDLPDLMATIAPRPLLLADPVDGYRRGMTIEKLALACERPYVIYSLLHAAGAFGTLAGTEKPAMPAAIALWLRTRLQEDE